MPTMLEGCLQRRGVAIMQNGAGDVGPTPAVGYRIRDNVGEFSAVRSEDGAVEAR